VAGALMTVEQYEARLGRTLTGAKRDQAEALLADASDVVRRIAGGRLDGATSEDVPGPIRMVIFSMVTRAVRNPAGVSSERIADYQYSGARPLYPTGEEADLIRDAVDIPSVRVVPLAGDMPQRLLDQAAATPYYYLGE
jgi:hypothetical protein